MQKGMQSIDYENLFNSRQIDVVAHAATHYLKNHNADDVGALIESNVKFGTELIDAASRAGVELFVNFSSVWQLSQRGQNNSQKSLYAATKQALLEVCKFYAYSTPVRVLNIYLNDTFGANDNRYKLVPIIRRAILESKTLKLQDPQAQINLSLIDDVVEETSQLITRKLEQFAEFEIVARNSLSILEVVSAMEEISGQNLKIEYGEKFESKSTTPAIVEKAPTVEKLFLERSFRDGLCQSKLF
jgi:nucleoside-diphosphate-sugar epimerase